MKIARLRTDLRTSLTRFKMFILVRRPWLRRLGYLTCAITVTTYLTVYLEEEPLCATYTSDRPGILKPGQLQQVVGVAPVVDEVEYKGPVEADEMGMAHDIRFVTMLNVLQMSRYKDHTEFPVYCQKQTILSWWDLNPNQ